jgi:hypothetical protein
MNVRLERLYRKEKTMNNLLIILLLFFPFFNSNAQSELVGKTFKTNVLIGQKAYGNDDNLKIELSILEKENPWGLFIVLNADGSFRSYNQGWCGNECRVKIKGIYRIEGETVEFVVNEIKYSDICPTKPTETGEFSYGKFTISEEDGAVVLVK